ncbi:MAG: aminomethyl-transferring glycine dehydrogenase subunit GcvPB [Candidatus Marinimicrobia bacterium]|nr:aminomethyl-transferring glycine dehydrogenase subunit GcvPB [Candidatus Neomarinimicrobiota bacterium]
MTATHNATLPIFARSVPGRIGHKLPSGDVPATEPTSVLKRHMLRQQAAHLPEVSEPEVVRHYVTLSTRNHHIDKDIYPLGSCTMKYNPKINDAVAELPGFAQLHPLQGEGQIQGALELMFHLEQALKAMTGMHSFTLQPPAGSSGELVGVLMMRRYHQARDDDRKVIVIPDSAHGTNPASVVMAGYQTVKVATDDRGRVDLADLRSKLSSEVAGMMLTQPNTLGLFEDHIETIAGLVHEAGGLMYMDGANLNALIGLTRPADMGFDITHINLHKTFSTPHGGGGPGSGPIGVTRQLSSYLPAPRVAQDISGVYRWDEGQAESIGRVHGHFGNFGMLVRAYAYILALGGDGLANMSRRAVLNANYLKSTLTDIYDLPYGDGTMHEFVLSGRRQKERGIKTLDIAKKLLDYGVHAPTVYFPLVVPEALMIEPTESETRSTLDRFSAILREIDGLVDSDPDGIRAAPRNTPVRRLDETTANRELDVHWMAE